MTVVWQAAIEAAMTVAFAIGAGVGVLAVTFGVYLTIAGIRRLHDLMWRLTVWQQRMATTVLSLALAWAIAFAIMLTVRVTR